MSDTGKNDLYEVETTNVEIVTRNIIEYSTDYRDPHHVGFSWRPETFSYFYATILLESLFGTDTYESIPG